jgi:peptidyl-dipeptidase Dcp
VPPWDRLDVGAGGDRRTPRRCRSTRPRRRWSPTNPEAPTFANTLVPLEDAGRHLDRLDALFGVMTSNLSTPAVQAVDKEWSPKGRRDLRSASPSTRRCSSASPRSTPRARR